MGDEINTTYIRTISSFINVNDKITNNILKFMTHESKNIYNATVFHTNVFLRYKYLIFKKLYTLVDDDIITDIILFDEVLYSIYEKYCERYVKIKYTLRTNNQIIYNVIKKYLKQSNITIMNNNFNDIKSAVINIIDRHNLIVVSERDKNELYLDIVSNILTSMYRRSFNDLRDRLINHQPCNNFDRTFINQVKNNEYLFPVDNRVNYKSLLAGHKIFKSNKGDTIKSDRNYISRIMYRKYTKCTIPSDLMCNIISKVYDSFSSYFALITKGKRANKPSYLNHDGHFILPYFARSRKLIKKNGKWCYKLTIGNYIAERYSDVVDDNKFVCLNPNAKVFKKYVDEKYLLSREKGKKILKRDNLIIGNKYIRKDSNKIFDANYIYVEKPDIFDDDQLLLIEINPLYHGTRFKVNFTYKVNNTQNAPVSTKVISIDPGMTNLLVIHDPRGEQLIIKGSHVKNINKYYNKKIDEHKKKLATYNSKNRKMERKNKTLPNDQQKKLLNNIQKGMETKSKKTIKYFTEGAPLPKIPKQSKIEIQRLPNHYFDILKKIESGQTVTEFDKLKTSKRLYKLYLDRNNQIDNYFNHICNWILNKYSDCGTIIIGNNKGWKTNCNMGKRNNRAFYEIPYRKLFDKLIHKAEQNNQKVCIIEESYTSKCDALALEEIRRHSTYLGQRSKRGLFKSSKGKLINADLNGAINIMRKWYERNNMQMKRIRGKNLFNPKCVSLSEIMKRN